MMTSSSEPPDDALAAHVRAHLAGYKVPRTFVRVPEVARSDDRSVAAMKAILSDRSHPQLPIYRHYAPDPELGHMGTVCTIVMDLPNRRFHVRKGNDQAGEWLLACDGSAGASRAVTLG